LSRRIRSHKVAANLLRGVETQRTSSPRRCAIWSATSGAEGPFLTTFYAAQRARLKQRLLGEQHQRKLPALPAV